MFSTEEFRSKIQSVRMQKCTAESPTASGSSVEPRDLLERISEKQEEWLVPLKEDLARWLNLTLGETHITASNFMDVLDNGILVCRLAKLMSVRSSDSASQMFIPPFKFKWWENARSASFFARDNTDNFLRWCRQVGIKEAVMFESESLVLHTQPRTVVLCLLELARIAAQCGMEPPGIVKLEREIDCKLSEGSSKARRPLSVSVPTTPCNRESAAVRKSSFVAHGERLTAANGSVLNGSRSATVHRSHSIHDESDSHLHRKVMQIAGNCCSRSHVQRVSDGKYIIGGKIVFIRLLNDRHVMVRVGGGWDTLEHFTSKHDPCFDMSCPKLAPSSRNSREEVGDERPKPWRPSKSSI